MNNPPVIEADDNVIEVDRSLICPILTHLYRDGDSDETVRIKASNALIMRSVVTASVVILMALSAAYNAEKVFLCSPAVNSVYLSILTFLTCCLVRDALCILPMRKSTDPRRQVD